MKRTVLVATFGIIALTTIWVLGQCAPFHREQVPGIALGAIRDGSPFVAQLDCVRYGRTTGVPEAPYDYVIIFLKKADGTKIAVIDHKPDIHTLQLVGSLKDGATYDFPKVLSGARADSGKQLGETGASPKRE